MKFLEDIEFGERTAIGQHTFGADEIKRFATLFDPQRFHIDEAAAAQTHFGALCASGWHTGSMWMRLMVDHYRVADEAMRARGEPVAAFGPSPGFTDLKWLKPVFVGDTISYYTQVLHGRVSGSRPGWGLLTVHNTGENQRGELVISFESTVFVQSRQG